MTRDIIFYLIAIGWILFVFLYSNEVYLWEPLGKKIYLEGPKEINEYLLKSIEMLFIVLERIGNS